MKEYENEVRLFVIKKDSTNPHQHRGIHPYVIIKNFGSFCLVAPCTSNIAHRVLPTHIRIKSVWDRESVVLVEQMITVPTAIVSKGKFCTNLCDEDIENIRKATFVQLGIHQNLTKNVMKGSVYHISLPRNQLDYKTSDSDLYIVMSNEKCNAYSPVVHVLPLSKERQSDRDRAVYGFNVSGYAMLENIALIPKELLNRENYYGELKKGSVFAVNKAWENIISSSK